MKAAAAANRIGFVRPQGPMGDGIRYAAVLRYLEECGFSVVDLPMAAERAPEPKIDILRAGIAALAARTGGPEARLSATRQNLQTLRSYRHAVAFGEKLATRRDLQRYHAETHLAAVACMTAGRLTGLPWIYDMHGLVPEERAGAGNPPFSVEAAERWEREVIVSAHSIIVVSEAMADYLSAKYGVSRNKLVVAPNGTTLAPSVAQFARPLRVVYGGVFAYWERVDTFIELARDLSGTAFEFHLIGDGPLREELLSKANREGASILYHGKKSRERTIELFSTMQIGVAPSSNDVVRRTASPIKVLDYAACGLPVVAPDTGWWTQELARAGAGVIVPENSSSALAEGIRSLNDPTVWQAFSDAARMWVKSSCSWARALTPIGDLYGEAIEASVYAPLAASPSRRVAPEVPLRN